MPKTVVEYRCLVISPGDVAEEREAVVDVIHRWNASVGANRGIRVEPVRWETHTHPDMSGPAQAKVNEQIVDQCDFGIAVFWSRVGTPTAEYDSGSVEEVDRLVRRGAKVMLYRSSRPIPPDKLDTRQFDKLKGLLESYRDRGLLGQFADINELRELVNKDLSLLLGREPHIEGVPPSSGVETATRPDVRVKTRVVVTPAATSGTETALQITVENHSPRPLFLSSVGLKLADGRGLWFKRDSLLGTPNAPQKIEPGDAYSFHVTPDALMTVDVQSVVCAEAYDKIGRVFNSDAEETKKSLESLMQDKRRQHSDG